MENMPFPQVMVCTSQGFKSEVLTDIGLREDSLRFAQFITHTENHNITDIEGLWDNATHSSEDFSVTWTVITGNST